MGARVGASLITGPSHVDIPETVYLGEKSGYYSADILQYGRFNIRGKGDPQKTIKFEDGVLYAPGARGMPTPVILVQKGLEKGFQDELFEIIDFLEKANFKTKGVATETEDPQEIAKAVMQRGNIYITLKCKTKDEKFSWPSPSSFSICSLFVDHPKRYVGNRVILSYQIDKVEKISEEEKLLIEGINVELLQKYNFKN